MKEKKIVPAICSFACFKNLADIEYDNYVQLNYMIHAKSSLFLKSQS